MRRGRPPGAPRLPVAQPRPEAVLRRRHRRRRRARAGDRLLPGQEPRHHQRRRPRDAAGWPAATWPATRDHPLQLPVGRERRRSTSTRSSCGRGSPRSSTTTCCSASAACMNLAHNLRDVREAMRRVNANRLNGIDAEWLDAEEVKELCPIVDVSPDVRYPVLGATFQPRGGIAKHDHVAWGYARAADELGVDLIESCRGDRHRQSTADRVAGVQTSAARSAPGRSRSWRPGTPRCVAGRWPGSACRSSPIPLQALVSELLEPVHPTRRHVERRPRLRQPGAQGRAGHGRRHRQLQRLRPARRVPHHRAPDGRGRRARSRSSPGRTCCGRGAGSSTCRRTPRRSSADAVGGLYLDCGWGHGRLQGDAGLRRWCLAHTIANDETARAKAAVRARAVHTGALIDEHGAAAVATHSS